MRLPALPALLLLAACAGPPPAPPPLAPREVVELQRWDVFDGAERVGAVLRLEIRDPSGPIPFYQVRDREGRLLGSADAQLRFSRRVPFRDDEEPIGVYALADGVTQLVGAKARVQLRPVPVEADAKKR
ncbi:MAG: hypothetical protein FJ265_11075 [Planctomycetes bacterium]|nr:hypothetical protein [Planctomycetota bacterium]